MLLQDGPLSDLVKWIYTELSKTVSVEKVKVNFGLLAVTAFIEFLESFISIFSNIFYPYINLYLADGLSGFVQS